MVESATYIRTCIVHVRGSNVFISCSATAGGASTRACETAFACVGVHVRRAQAHSHMLTQAHMK